MLTGDIDCSRGLVYVEIFLWIIVTATNMKTLVVDLFIVVRFQIGIFFRVKPFSLVPNK